jgi:hypothetical protein
VTAAEHERQQRVDRLAAAARQRTARAERHAEQTIRRMLRDGQQVTFRGVHRRSGLSLDFLYTNPMTRARIYTARDTPTSPTTAVSASPVIDRSEGTVVRVLTGQLQALKGKYRRDIDELRCRLAAATGEILSLREQARALQQLAEHERH